MRSRERVVPPLAMYYKLLTVAHIGKYKENMRNWVGQSPSPFSEQDTLMSGHIATLMKKSTVVILKPLFTAVATNQVKELLTLQLYYVYVQDLQLELAIWKCTDPSHTSSVYIAIGHVKAGCPSNHSL